MAHGGAAPRDGKQTVSTNHDGIEREKGSARFARSPRRLRRGRRGRRGLEAAGIVDDVGPESEKGTANSRRFTSSRLAWLGGDVEEVEAHLPLVAICSGRRGTPAMARRSSSTDAVAARVCSNGRNGERERERAGQRERASSGWSPYPLGGARSVEGTRGELGHAQRPPWSLQREGDDRRFSGNPLPFYFSFYFSPFLCYFLFFYF